MYVCSRRIRYRASFCVRWEAKLGDMGYRRRGWKVGYAEGRVLEKIVLLWGDGVINKGITSWDSGRSRAKEKL